MYVYYIVTKISRNRRCKQLQMNCCHFLSIHLQCTSSQICLVICHQAMHCVKWHRLAVGGASLIWARVQRSQEVWNEPMILWYDNMHSFRIKLKFCTVICCLVFLFAPYTSPHQYIQPWHLIIQGQLWPRKLIKFWKILTVGETILSMPQCEGMGGGRDMMWWNFASSRYSAGQEYGLSAKCSIFLRTASHRQA